jgi:hypothetical protein
MIVSDDDVNEYSEVSHADFGNTEMVFSPEDV